MDYKTFLESIKIAVQKKLGVEYQVTLNQILKNNGILLDGLSITSFTAPSSPTIFMNAYYGEIENGLSLSSIAEQILLLYEEQAQLPIGLNEKLQNFNSIKDTITFKLINSRANELLLSNVPYFDFLDLAVVFYLLVSEDEYGQMTALIHDEHLRLWNVDKEILLKLAEQNTPLLLPAKIERIESALAEIQDMSENDLTFLEHTPMYLYVLSNKSGINGASCLLYKDILKNFAEQEGDDLIILPSSIHEVLLTPEKKAFPYEDLNTMISLINESDVPVEERLSDHIYHYSREQNCITIPFNFSESDETGNPQ